LPEAWRSVSGPRLSDLGWKGKPVENPGKDLEKT